MHCYVTCVLTIRSHRYVAFSVQQVDTIRDVWDWMLTRNVGHRPCDEALDWVYAMVGIEYGKIYKLAPYLMIFYTPENWCYMRCTM